MMMSISWKGANKQKVNGKSKYLSCEINLKVFFVVIISYSDEPSCRLVQILKEKVFSLNFPPIDIEHEFLYEFETPIFDDFCSMKTTGAKFKF